MSKTTQARKHTIGMAGEFHVAGELLRHGVMAAVTYGNAKKADVVAFARGRAVSIEVKSTSEQKWVVGGNLPPESDDLWVLVFLPPNLSQPPEYFVLTSRELRAAMMPRHTAYMRGYRERTGKDFEGKGVASVWRRELKKEHAGAWFKVNEALDRLRHSEA